MEMKPKERTRDEKILMQFSTYVYATRPVIRDNQGNVTHKRWNLPLITKYIGRYPRCMKALVNNYFETVKDIGADIFHQEVEQPVYETLVKNIYERDTEVAVDFAHHLPPQSSLFKDIIAEAIEKDLDISPLIGVLYTKSPELYRLFAQKQAKRPTKKGLKAVLNFFPEMISCAADKPKKRLEFSMWLDLMERYLENSPHDISFLVTGYKLFKAKDEGASAYLLKEVIMRHAPSLF